MVGRVRRLRLRLLAGASLAALVAVAVLFVAGLGWTGGVHGRWGDLLLGVHPGQVRVGWSQDWSNAGGWLRMRLERRPAWPALGFLGGQTFTSAPPHEIAIDLPAWLLAVPPALLFAWSRRRLAALPRGPACGRCGYDLRGAAGRTCPECGRRIA